MYVKYRQEEEAADALKALHGRFYSGSSVQAEFSPVTEFREARCRQFDETGCGRGPWCNFMHLKGEQWRPRTWARLAGGSAATALPSRSGVSARGVR